MCISQFQQCPPPSPASSTPSGQPPALEKKQIPGGGEDKEDRQMPLRGAKNKGKCPISGIIQKATLLKI